MKTFPLAIAAFLLAAPAFADDVTVTVTGVQAGGGTILAALQTKDEFLKPEGHLGAKAAATPGAVTLVIHDVPPGDYSLSVLHDADGDMKMAMKDGMPAEGWTMKNAAALRGAPTWDVVSFKVAGPVAITEAMIYPQR